MTDKQIKANLDLKARDMASEREALVYAYRRAKEIQKWENRKRIAFAVGILASMVSIVVWVLVMRVQGAK